MAECWAGRKAFFSGRWKTPCPDEAIHVIVNTGPFEIELCDTHFEEVLAAGLITDPYLSGAEEAERYRQAGRRG